MGSSSSLLFLLPSFTWCPLLRIPIPLLLPSLAHSSNVQQSRLCQILQEKVIKCHALIHWEHKLMDIHLDAKTFAGEEEQTW
jgi:hypothetical protein